MNRLWILLLFSFIPVHAYGAESSQHFVRLPFILAVRGMDGRGSETDYVADLLSVPLESVTQSPIPRGRMYNGKDFGQIVCMRDLAKAFPRSTDVVVHATSQGAATVLNYIATLSAYEQSYVKAVILEGPMASGNSAIMQRHSYLKYIPFMDYIFPYFAKFYYPYYCPSGKQAIKSLATIEDIPIVIIHARNDPILPYSGACALYAGLRMKGHKNVYFVTCEGQKHIRLLEDVSPEDVMQKRLNIAALLHHREIIQASPEIRATPGFARDLEEVALKMQPDVAPFRSAYEELRLHEDNHVYGAWVLRFALLYMVYRLIKYKVAQLHAKNGIDDASLSKLT